MVDKKKIAAAAVAAVTAAALLVGGTFAWQSISQTALNEASDVINPGGRLHDDFYIDNNGEYNADIYVENFAEDEIFARVKLQEYMEIVINQGVAGAETVETVVGEKSLDGTPVTDKATDNTSGYEYAYVTHYFDQENATDAYWKWFMGDGSSAEVWYMPTFNMNKDSLVADRNGMYVDRIGGISNRSQAQYEDWTVWAQGDTKPGDEIHDTDINTADEVGYNFENLETYENDGHIAIQPAQHEAKPVGYTNGLISMSDWLQMIADNGDVYDADIHGNYWVYDIDGWVYWSSPIAGGEATGLLLDGIELNQVMDDTWYYAINVIGQFVTPDDIGKDDDTGFYEDAENRPSDNAEILLEHISTGVSDGEQDEEDPDQIYTMHLYINGSDGYLVPGETYELEVAAEENEYDDTAVTLSIQDATGRKLTPGVDYEFGSDTVAFDEFSGNYGGNYAQSAITTLKILNEDLVGEYVTIIAEADQTGNTETTEVSVNYERLDVEITLYAQGEDTPAAGTNYSATIAPNSIYDIVGTITGRDGTEYVIYSTLVSRPVSANIDVPDCDVVAHAGDYHEANHINENGQLVVGNAETFDCDEWQEDGITNLDALTMAIGADVVRIYASEEAKNSDAEPTEIYYTYGQWDLFPAGKESYHISVADEIYVSQQDRMDSLTISDGNDRDITEKENLDVTLSGNKDADTKIELIPTSQEQYAFYQLTLGEDETATELTITAVDNNGSGSKTIKVNYLNVLKIGSSTADQWNEIYINSTNHATTAEISYLDYWGSPVDGVNYTLSGQEQDDTYVEGSTLHIGASEQGWPMTLTVNGEPYSVYVTYTEPPEDTTVPAVTVADGETAHQTITISNVEADDYPLTVKLYELETTESEYTENALVNTVTITNVVDGTVEWEQNLSGYSGRIQSCETTEDGTIVITSNFTTSNGDGSYLAVAVMNQAGKENKAEPLFVEYLSGCFTAGTQVHTPSGLVNIENIQIGDEVCSIDLTTGAVVTNPVIWVQENVYASAVYTIYAGGEEITATAKHPFYVVGEDWVTVEALRVGDKLVDRSGNEIMITNIVCTELDKPIQVYNFTVDGTHNYLITESGILVHNKL